VVTHTFTELTQSYINQGSWTNWAEVQETKDASQLPLASTFGCSGIAVDLVVDSVGSTFVLTQLLNQLDSVTPSASTFDYCVQKVNNQGQVNSQWKVATGLPFSGSIERGMAIDPSTSELVIRIENFNSCPTNNVNNFVAFDSSSGVMTKILNFSTGCGRSSAFDNFGGLAIDSSGMIYMGAQITKQIFQLDANGNMLKSWQLFQGPIRLAMDTQGRLVVSTYDSSRQIGSLNQYLPGISRTGNQLQLSWTIAMSYPQGVATDYLDQVYAVDVLDQTLSKFSATGSPLSVFAVQVKSEKTFTLAVSHQDVYLSTDPSSINIVEFSNCVPGFFGPQCSGGMQSDFTILTDDSLQQLQQPRDLR
jgi:hypothetical protein